MKIAFLTNVFSATGGVGNYVMRVTDAFLQKGIAVTVIHNDEKPAGLRHSLLKLERVPDFDAFEPADSPAKIKAVMEILGREKPDLVHVQVNNHFELDSEIRKNYPAVKSIHVYDFCPSGNKFHHALGKICRHSTGPKCVGRMIYKRCTTSWRPSTISLFYRRAMQSIQNDAQYKKVIVASRYVRQEALASGYSATQVEVLPYFAEAVPESSGVILRDPKGLLHRAEDPETEKVVMFTGRLFPEKGLSYLLRAMALLAPNLQWKLAVDGDGPLLNETKRLAEKLGIASKVDFAGWLAPQAHEDLYRRASVVVVPSRWPEPFGMVGIEAMSHGKPVVAFDVGGISDWLEDQKTGFLIKPYDLAAMARRIAQLIQDPALSQKMGEEGRARVLREFTMEQHLEKLLKIYGAVS